MWKIGSRNSCGEYLHSAVLAVIESSEPTGMHGYAILNELKNRTNDRLILEEGNLYPTLKKLKDANILTTTDRLRRKT